MRTRRELREEVMSKEYVRLNLVFSTCGGMAKKKIRQ